MPPVCTIEVGISRVATSPITISCRLRKFPEKVGELLASTHLFATQNYLNNLRGTPPAKQVKWRAYAILAIRKCGVLYFQMDLDNRGCRVKLLHDGDGMHMLGSVITHAITNIKSAIVQ